MLRDRLDELLVQMIFAGPRILLALAQLHGFAFHSIHDERISSASCSIQFMGHLLSYSCAFSLHRQSAPRP